MSIRKLAVAAAAIVIGSSAVFAEETTCRRTFGAVTLDNGGNLQAFQRL